MTKLSLSLTEIKCGKFTAANATSSVQNQNLFFQEQLQIFATAKVGGGSSVAARLMVKVDCAAANLFATSFLHLQWYSSGCNVHVRSYDNRPAAANLHFAGKKIDLPL